MRRVVINTQNALFGDAIVGALRNSRNDLNPYLVDDPDKIVDECKWLSPYALLMEVTGYTPWLFEERMKVRDMVKEKDHNCKIVLIVDENADKDIAERVKQAKKDGLIDQFIYGSISSAYFVDIIDCL